MDSLGVPIGQAFRRLFGAGRRVVSDGLEPPERLCARARAAELAADRLLAWNPAARRLGAARDWREYARRTGDAIALRNAALAAERALQAAKAKGAIKDWAAARCEQALCALLGADLYGDEAMTGPAETALRDVIAAAPTGPWAAVAAGRLAVLKARAARSTGTGEAALDAAAAFDAPIAALAAAVRRSLLPHGLLDQLQCDRADVLLACGVRLGDARLLATARQVLDALSGGPASARDPLVRVRVQSLRAVAHARLGLAQDRIEDIAGAVELLVATLDGLRPEHSPLDWARLQRDLAITLQSLGEHSQTDRAFEHALSCYGRALWITREQPILALHAALAQDQAACLAQRARLAAEPGMLDAAVETLRRGLAALDPARDPVGWAIAQVNLAQLYLARLDLTGREADRASAGLALAGALDVFAEHGLRSMVDQANASLDRLRGWPASGVSS